MSKMSLLKTFGNQLVLLVSFVSIEYILIMITTAGNSNINIEKLNTKIIEVVQEAEKNHYLKNRNKEGMVSVTKKLIKMRKELRG